MKKIRLTAISILFIIIFSLGITGCTNGTSIQNPSSAPETVIPTQPSSSSSVGNNNAIDYNQYIKKVWIMKSWSKGAYNYSSFRISKIANGEIEGKFATGEIAVPDYYFYLPGHLGYLGNLTGTINNNIAESQFSDKRGDRGNVKLVFKKSDEIEATIKYTNKLEADKDKSLDGTFLFKPYNLKDIGGFSPFNDQSFTVDLNSWGTVKFVSGKILGGNHIPTVAYLTNKDGDIYYDFTSFIPNNVNIKAVSFQDINKDRLKDIVIIFNGGDDSSMHFAKVFFQKSDGSFYDDGELDQEINDSGNNKDIKTITDYLSKKF